MQYCVHCMSVVEQGALSCTRCGKDFGYTAPDYHLKPGVMLAGKILIGAALGEGGFGITYVGRDINLNMNVAVKEYFPAGFANRSNTVSSSVGTSPTGDKHEFYVKGKDRFLKEAQILARFAAEPGIVGILDFFEANNTAYIVMEFLDGVDLKGHIAKNGLLSPKSAIHLLRPAMESLQKVHTQSLIHRDISPDNIMVCGSKVKLLDFGAARSVSAEANKSLSVVLKPGYAPEEQYRSRGNQGPWTDVYAMCATIYKCTTGVTPDDATQRMFRDELKRPSELGVKIGPATEQVLMKGLAVRQENRFQTMGALLSAFSEAEAADAVDETQRVERRKRPEETVVIDRRSQEQRRDVSVSGDVSNSVTKKRNVAFWVFSAATLLLGMLFAFESTKYCLASGAKAVYVVAVVALGVLPLTVSVFASVRRGSLKNAVAVLVPLFVSVAIIITTCSLVYFTPMCRYRGEWNAVQGTGTYRTDSSGNVDKYYDGKWKHYCRVECDGAELRVHYEDESLDLEHSVDGTTLYVYDSEGKLLGKFERRTNLPF